MARRLFVVGLALAVAGVITQATSLKQSLSDTEGRCKAAESGARATKAKGGQNAE